MIHRNDCNCKDEVALVISHIHKKDILFEVKEVSDAADDDHHHTWLTQKKLQAGRDLQVHHSSALTPIVPPLLIVSKHSSSLFLLACQILPPFITKGRARINAIVPLVLVVSEHASYTELGDGLMHGKEISQLGQYKAF